MIRIACNLCDVTMPSDGGVCLECGNSTSHVHESHVIDDPVTDPTRAIMHDNE